MLIWHIDQLKSPLGSIDIVIIRDEANDLSPRRRPRQELPLLSENMADIVAHARTATQATSAPTDTTTIKYIPGSSTTPSSSRSDHSRALVPLARVQKLEAQMDTFLHHIQPWMQRPIAEAEERLHHKMAHNTERKIVEVH